MHEHIARAMYYFSVHLLYASSVGCVAWVLTSIRGESATTKYWIWVVTAFNFVVPVGALIDKVWAPHLTWAHPLGAIGDPVWRITEGRTAVVVGVIWIGGAAVMFTRLMLGIRAEHRDARMQTRLVDGSASSEFAGVPVSLHDGHPGPAVRGVFYPHILLPLGIDRVLNPRELHAVLIHEMAHARRRDNLICLFYEISLCVLWFHPLIWLAGARMALYRELSCDESVIRQAHGEALVSALAKLAVPEHGGFLQATASSHLTYRLTRLAGPARATPRAANLVVTSVFGAVIAVGVFQTIAHTACCFILKR